MIDIHCHILPGIDDGADSLETSVAMAEMAIEDGVTHIIGTPHAHPEYPFKPDIAKKRCEELQAKFQDRLIFATGCDFHLSFENLQEIRQRPERFTLNQKNYLLVEFADYSVPPAMDEALHRLQLAGLHPIITHPERNPLIRTNPDRLFQWLKQGCYSQITAQSIEGKFGRTTQECSERWLAAGAVHFVASDAHNVTTRPLRLKACFEKVARTHGEDLARALFVGNPLAAFEGRPLPVVPELVEEESPVDAAQSKRKRFWFF